MLGLWFKGGDQGYAEEDTAREWFDRGFVAKAITSVYKKHNLGAKSEEIEGILGYRGREEMIHRDDLVES